MSHSALPLLTFLFVWFSFENSGYYTERSEGYCPREGGSDLQWPPWERLTCLSLLCTQSVTRLAPLHMHGGGLVLI